MRSSPYLTAKEVADFMRCSEEQVHRLTRRHKLAFTRSGGKGKLFTMSDVQAYLRRHRGGRKRPAREVYFLEDIQAGAIKIGRSADLKKRLVTLKTAHFAPLRLLATVPGNHKDERAFHEHFAAERINPEREWYWASVRLLEFIEEFCGWRITENRYRLVTD